MSKSFKFAFEAAFPSGVITTVPVTVQQRAIYNDETYQWEPITTRFHLDKNKEELAPLMTILSNFYQFGTNFFRDLKSITLDTIEKNVKEMLGHAKLSMLVPTPNKCPHCQSVLGIDNGPLKTIEEWEMHFVWPHSVNFGELCYSSPSKEDITIEVTWRFKDCEYRRLF